MYICAVFFVHTKYRTCLPVARQSLPADGSCISTKYRSIEKSQYFVCNLRYNSLVLTRQVLLKRRVRRIPIRNSLRSFLRITHLNDSPAIRVRETKDRFCYMSAFCFRDSPRTISRVLTTVSQLSCLSSGERTFGSVPLELDTTGSVSGIAGDTTWVTSFRAVGTMSTDNTTGTRSGLRPIQVPFLPPFIPLILCISAAFQSYPLQYRPTASLCRKSPVLDEDIHVFNHDPSFESGRSFAQGYFEYIAALPGSHVFQVEFQQLSRVRIPGPDRRTTT